MNSGRQIEPGQAAAATEREATVGQVGEDGLLDVIRPLLSEGPLTLLGSGDDAAIVAAPDGRFVVSTDILVQDYHFTTEWCTGYDVGWRAVMQNAADIAAMAARPTAMVAAVTLPADLPVSWVRDLARGLGEASARCGLGVVGGDLSGGSSIAVAITVHGDLAGHAPVRRAGARVGDVVALAGPIGRSAAGLALLQAGKLSERPEAAELVDAYRRPCPPLTAAIDAHRAHAMLDVSDGLLRDAGRLARASGVCCDIDSASSGFTGDRAALAWAESVLDVPAQRWILGGGEDHPFLAAFAPGELPPQFRAIGTVGPASPDGPVTVDGRQPDRREIGWDHFRG